MGSFETAGAPLLVLFVAIVANAIGEVVAARRGVDLHGRLWTLAILTLVAARLGYVWQFHAAYFAAPGSIIDIRDGGWSPEAGFVALWLRSMWLVRRYPKLKGSIRAAVVSGTLLWSFGALALATRAPEVEGIALPSLKLSTQAGQPVDLESMRGKPVVVNLWATWCPPCNREMPVLAKAQADRPDVNFVFVNQGESLMEVGRWLGEQRLALRNVMLDPHLQAGAALGQRAFPTSYFFDADGHLVDTRIGELSAGVLADKLKRIAPQGGSAAPRPTSPISSVHR